MLPDIINLGFLGGLVISFVSYIDTIANVQPEMDIETSNETVQIWEDIWKTFEIKRLALCIVHALIGGIFVYVINPQSPLLAFYLGMTAYPTVSKFAAVLHVNKLA